jgi:hypothetical protein
MPPNRSTMSALFPKADKPEEAPTCPLCANSDLTRRSKPRRYSITSSTRASSDGEISRQAFAALRGCGSCVVEVWLLRLRAPKSAKSGVAGNTHLSFCLLALGVADFAPVCPWQLAVQSASAARQSFGTAYGVSLRSGDSRSMLHAINA